PEGGQGVVELGERVAVALGAGRVEPLGEPAPSLLRAAGLRQHGAAHEVHGYIGRIEIAQERERPEGVVDAAQARVLHGQAVPGEWVTAPGGRHLLQDREALAAHRASTTPMNGRLRYRSAQSRP